MEDLAEFGTDLSTAAVDGTLARAYGVDEYVDSILQILKRSGPRSVVLLGESGVGKSAIVHELVHRLFDLDESDAWEGVLRISATEFMTGTRYLGEWETRVNNLIREVRAPRRIILYVPKISELVGMGAWSKSPANVASALAPHIEDGSIVIIGESTPEEYEVGLGAMPSLNRLFEKIQVPAASEEKTREILSAAINDSGLALDDSVLDYVFELSGQYLGHCARPGNAVELLRQVITHGANAKTVTPRMVLDALSRSTGIPAEFLDDAVPIEIDKVRSFFESRVMGQPEAVDAVVDLIALIKAGLTDQGKPFGVFLFIGPTGVGKTELARAVAEYVFGDVNRLQRFDMSEFASYEGFERLIGVGTQKSILTDAVRQKPFSVVLLDEIEKSHVNVFDLCLQLFDAGRLTDGNGRTVDFRRTILILTSNIGASAPRVFLGFGAQPEPMSPVDVDRERTFQALSRVFRPEFLNRIDRIVNFRPLSLEVAESIARREVNAVLQRSGIVRRNIVVDIDTTVLSLLLKEGYSPTFGARPLKRAVEKIVLMPLAKAIATGRIARETVLRLSATGDRVDVKIVSTPKISTKAPIKQDDSLIDRVVTMVDRIEEIEEQVFKLSDRKTSLLHEIHKPGFYQDKKRVSAIFDEIHKLDQFLSAYEGLCKVVSGVQERLERKVSKAEYPELDDRINQLSVELAHLSFVATRCSGRDLSDALIRVSLVDYVGERLNGVDTLVNMYIGFAKRWRLTFDILAESLTAENDCVYLRIVGLGAYVLLKNETGLHQLDNKSKLRTAKDKTRTEREVVRVTVLPLSEEADGTFMAKVKTTVTQPKSKTARFLKKPLVQVRLFHEASLNSIEAVFSGSKDDAIRCAQTILWSSANSPLEVGSDNAEEAIRHYELGADSRVRDARSGQTTTKVDQILKGNLAIFLTTKS